MNDIERIILDWQEALELGQGNPPSVKILQSDRFRLAKELEVYINEKCPMM